ncbi:MAG: YncE family protein [Clostridioides sp.]|jgi:YVTN family beta-propeller protein|nr:YncE family protein [Clostridioides sp.]
MVGNRCNCKNQGLGIIGSPGDLCSKYIYVANEGSNSIAVIDSDTNQIVKEICLGFMPYALAVNPIVNAVYVVNKNNNSVTVIDSTINEIIENITVGYIPVSVAVDPSTNIVYVVNYGSNTLSLINGYTNNVISVLNTGFGPYGITINPATNRVYVSNTVESTITVIDGYNKTVLTKFKATPTPGKIAVDCVNNFLYVISRDNSNIDVIDCNTNNRLYPHIYSLDPRDVAVNQNTGKVYITRIEFFNYAYSSIVQAIDGNKVWDIEHNSRYIEVGCDAYGISVDSMKNLIYVTNPSANNIVVLDGDTEQVIGSIEGLNRPRAIAQCILGS